MSLIKGFIKSGWDRESKIESALERVYRGGAGFESVVERDVPFWKTRQCSVAFLRLSHSFSIGRMSLRCGIGFD